MRSRAAVLYACTLFLAGTLLFLVQPMFAKMVLPLLGGSPAVWNTAMVFYQVALLASYLYAHASRRWLSDGQQVALHLVLLALPLVVLPIAAPHAWSPPTDTSPIPWLLGLMTVAIGLPFCIIATTSPLMQAWFSQLDDPAAKNPYALYVASNAGSMLALISYPLLLEPRLPLAAQSRLWTFGYALFAVLSAGCALVFRRSMRAVTPAEAVDTPTTMEPFASTAIGFGRQLRWLLLAFVPSSLMLSVTMYLSTNIAPIPLLWAAVLAVYLLTFILAFGSKQLVPRGLVTRITPVAVLLLVLTMLIPIRLSIGVLVAVHITSFFVIALACHSALADDVPDASRLTGFYLWLSVGGALGGIFNAIIAPLVFTSVMEYPIVLAIACLLIRPSIDAVTTEREGGARPHRNWLRTDPLTPMDVALPLLLASIMFACIAVADWMHVTSPPLRAGLTAGLPAILCFGLSSRQIPFALGVVALVAVNAFAIGNPRQMLAVRSFFGITRVVSSVDGAYTQMVHGSTLHGMQARDPARRRDPLSYYYPSGPIGLVIASREHAGTLKRVAVVGLGTGTLACYARPGQTWTFYEIDPAVRRIALDSRWFTFVRDCAPDAKIVLGDARLSLRKESAAAFDLIILDAYSSDAIPIHLITREALALYRDKLAPGGAIVFHISNLFFDLGPIVTSLASDAGMAARRMHDSPVAAVDDSLGKWSSEWVVVARDSADFGVLTRDPRWVTDRRDAAVAVWTDDFSSALSALRFK
jgi:hypothetical protein